MNFNTFYRLSFSENEPNEDLHEAKRRRIDSGEKKVEFHHWNRFLQQDSNWGLLHLMLDFSYFLTLLHQELNQLTDFLGGPKCIFFYIQGVKLMFSYIQRILFLKKEVKCQKIWALRAGLKGFAGHILWLPSENQCQKWKKIHILPCLGSKL